MAFELTVLGAGSILPRDRHGPAGYALRRVDRAGYLLFDCGPGSIRMLGPAGLALEELEAVVLSHYHPDHCLDLFALAFALRSPSLRRAKRARLKLVGPRGLRDLLERGAALGGERGWTAFEDAEVVEVDPTLLGGETEAAGFRLRHWPTRHTPHAVCWRAEDDAGAACAYSGDSGPEGELAACARGADLFVCECSFADDEAVERHMTPRTAAEAARAAGARELMLTHVYPGLDPGVAAQEAARHYDGEIRCARDLMRVVRPRS